MPLSSLTIERSIKQARRVYLILILVTLIAAAALWYFKGRDLLEMIEVTKANAAKIESMETEKTQAQTAYLESRTAFSADLEDFSRTIGKIVPQGERYTELTRALDDYFAQNFDARNPIVASGLRFGKGAPISGTPFFNLPVNLTITSSRENFLKFLRYIEQSGTIESGIRFMDVQGIRVNFSDSEVSFTVDLRAIYRSSNGTTASANSNGSRFAE